MEDGKSCGTSKCCKCPCHKMLGILIVLIGVTFLLGDFGVISQVIVSIIWPILVILIGLKKMCPKGACKCCSGETK